MAAFDNRRYNPNETRIYFYCFECGPDCDDPSTPGKKKKDTPGQRVMFSEWRADCKVYCPRCGKLMIFDGDSLYDNLTGDVHFWIEEKNDDKIPRGHLYRFDLKGRGYISPRYVSPKPGESIRIDIIKEFERLQKEEIVAVQQMS